MTIPAILKALHRVVPDPVLVTDVGRHQIYAAHYFPVESSRSFITSGGLGTMGFGVPAAIGAKVGRPDRPVIDIAGDGSFMMTCQEIATAAAQDIPVLVLVMNDGCLGMIKQLQDTSYGKRYTACEFGRSVDFALLARSMGAAGIRVEREEDLVPAIERGLAEGRPCVIDCILEEAANVYPMVVGADLTSVIE